MTRRVASPDAEVEFAHVEAPRTAQSPRGATANTRNPSTSGGWRVILDGMERMGATSHVEITGVRTGPGGAVVLVELEARAGGGRISLAHLPDGETPAVRGLAIDGRPVVLVTDETPPAVLSMLPSVIRALPPAEATVNLTEHGAREALGALLPCFTDGLYSVSTATLPAAVRLPTSFVRDVATPVVIDLGPIAPDSGPPVVADLAGGVFALLAGRDALRNGASALVISASFIVEADGFERRHHDRAARERFARHPTHVFDEARLRDAVFAHAMRHTGADLGPFALDRVEPTWQLAQGIAKDLAAVADVVEVRGPERSLEGRIVEYKLGVEHAGLRFLVGLRTDDGRHLHEATVRRGGAYQATGLKPAARAIARCLRELVREEAS
jgi:hypothetical protein